jgi:SAM-dependent methyltransferase
MAPCERPMKNPWLNIPASDYEGHMDLPEVGQSAFLRKVFGASLAEYDSRAVLYLGCATGNGLAYIDSVQTQRLTAVDINPEYLRILRDRYAERMPCLQTVQADLNDYRGNGQRYSLIFAGLLFEYLAPPPLIARISTWLEEAGVLVVVLQLKHHGKPNVSDTPFTSLKRLDPIMNPVAEADFRTMAIENGLRELAGKQVALESGKRFYVGTYARSSAMSGHTPR